MFQRCFAACNVPVAWSEGFHPHMKMSFGPPLKTGWAGCDEYIDIVVERPVGAKFAERCNNSLPDGLRITEVSPLADSAPKLANDIHAATMEVRARTEDVFGSADISPDRLEALSRTLTETLSQTDNGEDAPRVLNLAVSEEGGHIGITYTSTMFSGRIVTPAQLFETAGCDPDSFAMPYQVIRAAQFVERAGEYVSPSDRRSS